jgi:alpha/beta superfamily hydrolase
VPLSEALDFARAQDLALTVLPDSSHFFHGKLVQLRELVAQQLQLFA